MIHQMREVFINLLYYNSNYISDVMFNWAGAFKKKSKFSCRFFIYGSVMKENTVFIDVLHSSC